MYGITKKDKKIIDKKIKNQKEFLKNLKFSLGEKTITALDSTYSSVINPKKYFAECNNRVNTIHKYAKQNGLKPVFMTLTAPSRFHKKDKKGNLIYSPKETALALSQIWAKFLRLKIFKHMKDDTGHGLVYFRVYEPHESGVPHIHAMLYLPTSYILSVKDRFYNYFKDFGNSHKAIGFKYNFKGTEGGAIAYVMKYILKTFTNENEELMDDMVYWFIKHRILRFLSSRTLAPLLVYRKVRYKYKDIIDDDYLRVDYLYKKGIIQRNFNDHIITFKYSTEDDHFEDIVYNKVYFDEESLKSETYRKNQNIYLYRKLKKNFGEEIASSIIDISLYLKEDEEIDDIEDIIAQIVYDKEYDKKFLPKRKLLKIDKSEVIEQYPKPYELTNGILLKYYKSLLHHKIVNLDHFYVVKKELIKRELIKDELISLNMF